MARFQDIPHWVSPARASLAAAGITDLTYERGKVYLPEGCFYELSTAVPGRAELEHAIREAMRVGADYILYPCVRHTEDRSRLLERGFLQLPWFIESVYRLHTGIESDLRAQTGGRNARKIQRQLRKHDRDYVGEIYFADDLPAHPWVTETFDRLHRKNLDKYGHTLNFYNTSVIELMLTLERRRRVFFYFCRDRQSGRVAQGLLGVLDPFLGEMQLLVQGIDPDVPRPGDNIYSSGYFDLYRRGQELGVSEFRLGRGAHLQKRSLGANEYHVLLNYLLPLNATREIALLLQALRAQSERRMDEDLASLAELCQGQGYSLPTNWK